MKPTKARTTCLQPLGLIALSHETRPGSTIARICCVTFYHEFTNYATLDAETLRDYIPSQAPAEMPPPDEPKRRVARKLIKKRKEERMYTMEIPKKFEDGDDVDEDCTAPRGPGGAMINQSVFGMIAAAGSQVDFNTRFEGSEDDEEESSEDAAKLSNDQIVPGTKECQRERQELSRDRDSVTSKPKRKLADNKLLRSLSHLGHAHRKHRPSSKLPTLLSESTSDASKSSNTGSSEHKEEMADMDTTEKLPSRGPPVMGQMLDAREQASAERPSFESRGSLDRLQESSASSEGDPASNLAKRLMEIFQFEQPEPVIEGVYLNISHMNDHEANEVR